MDQVFTRQRTQAGLGDHHPSYAAGVPPVGVGLSFPRLPPAVAPVYLARSRFFLLVLKFSECPGGNREEDGMKTQLAKQPKRSKPTVRIEDIKPRKDAKGGSTTGGAGAGKIKFNEFTIKKTTD